MLDVELFRGNSNHKLHTNKISYIDIEIVSVKTLVHSKFTSFLTQTKSVTQWIFFINIVSMYSFKDVCFSCFLEKLLMHSIEMNTYQCQFIELTNQIQCTVLKSTSYVTYCADRAFLLLLLFVYTTVNVSMVKTTKREYMKFILIKLFSDSVQYNVHCLMSS